MFVRGKKFLVVLALVLSTGLHWAALQTIAWATMLAENLQSSSVHDAMTKTFDGQHPCPLCKAIECGKKSEKKSEIEVNATRIELPPIEKCASLVTDEFLRSAFTLIDEFSESVSAPPLFHPPRAHLA